MAFYSHFLNQYSASCRSQGISNAVQMLDTIKSQLLACDKQCQEDRAFDEFARTCLAMESELSGTYAEFQQFVERLAKIDDVWRFWNAFVFRDCFAYIGLHIAIRGGLWNLRLASLKEICPLFTAFDHVHYRKIIPQHLAEVLTMPVEIRKCFEMRGFVCHIRGRKMHAVALDEAHEMLVNKDIKTTIVRPTKEYIDRVLYYYPVRAEAVKQLKGQLFPSSLHKHNWNEVTITDTSLSAKKAAENVTAIKPPQNNPMIC